MITFDFEKPIVELKKRIEDLESHAKKLQIDASSELKSLEEKYNKLSVGIYTNLEPYDRVKVARHPERPYTLDYINLICDDFIELHGDRRYADDSALIGGMATIDGVKVMVLGHQKGRNTKDNIVRNFGMANPEGYRKAMRLMEMASRFNLPIISFIDTPGAYPGIGAEERGQAEAIAVNLRDMMGIRVPIICVVIGEGGSGGALGIGIGNRVMIMANSYYTVISPEGCAAILFRDAAKASDAAKALRLTPSDLLKFKIVEEIIPEPLGGAHRDHNQAAANIKEALLRNLKDLSKLSPKKLQDQRYQKFRNVGIFNENPEGIVEQNTVGE